MIVLTMVYRRMDLSITGNNIGTQRLTTHICSNGSKMLTFLIQQTLKISCFYISEISEYFKPQAD